MKLIGLVTLRLLQLIIFLLFFFRNDVIGSNLRTTHTSTPSFSNMIGQSGHNDFFKSTCSKNYYQESVYYDQGQG